MNFKLFLKEMAVKASDQDFGYDAERRSYEYNRYYNGGDSLYKTDYTELCLHSDGSSMVAVLLDHNNKTIDYVSRFEKDSGPERKEECWSQYEVWKDSSINIRVAELLIKYILPKLKIISSDKYQTSSGEKLWKNILSTTNKSIKCGIFDTESDYVLYFDGYKLKELMELCYSKNSYRFFISHI